MEEIVSAGESYKKQKQHTISYVYYLLLARPDLHVPQGLLTSQLGITFLLGTGGVLLPKGARVRDDMVMVKHKAAANNGMLHEVLKCGDHVTCHTRQELSRRLVIII